MGWYGNHFFVNDNDNETACPCLGSAAFECDRPELNVSKCFMRAFNDRKGEWATVTLGVPSLTAVTYEEHQSVNGRVSGMRHNAVFDPEVQSKAITHTQAECSQGDLPAAAVAMFGVCGSSFGLKM